MILKPKAALTIFMTYFTTNICSSRTKTSGKQVQKKSLQKSVILSAQELKLGINLHELPNIRTYGIGLIGKTGYPGQSERPVPAAEDLPADGILRMKYVIAELLIGPTEEELKQGYISLISTATKLIDCKFLVDDIGVIAYLEFSEEIVKDIDDIKNELIQNQIMYTLISLGIPKFYGTKIVVKGKSLGYYATEGK